MLLWFAFQLGVLLLWIVLLGRWCFELFYRAPLDHPLFLKAFEETQRREGDEAGRSLLRAAEGAWLAELLAAETKSLREELLADLTSRPLLWRYFLQRGARLVSYLGLFGAVVAWAAFALEMRSLSGLRASSRSFSTPMQWAISAIALAALNAWLCRWGAKVIATQSDRLFRELRPALARFDAEEDEGGALEAKARPFVESDDNVWASHPQP